MKKQLIPKSARLIPTKQTREFHKKRNEIYTADKFETYTDWFYFIHIDPFTRWVHAIGMVLGSLLYLIACYKLWIVGATAEVLITFCAGAYFFFFLPLTSHYIYDGGMAKSTPDKFLPTFIPVIHINLLTLSGRYDRWLRKFIVKYPFTVEAWELVEKDSKKINLTF